MRNALYVGLIVAGVLLAGRVGDARVAASQTCYEDSVLLWSGDTNSHSLCWPIDDLWMLQEVK